MIHKPASVFSSPIRFDSTSQLGLRPQQQAVLVLDKPTSPVAQLYLANQQTQQTAQAKHNQVNTLRQQVVQFNEQPVQQARAVAHTVQPAAKQQQKDTQALQAQAAYFGRALKEQQKKPPIPLLLAAFSKNAQRLHQIITKRTHKQASKSQQALVQAEDNSKVATKTLNHLG